jgi:hypothetical protein
VRLKVAVGTGMRSVAMLSGFEEVLSTLDGTCIDRIENEQPGHRDQLQGEAETVEQVRLLVPPLVLALLLLRQLLVQLLLVLGLLLLLLQPQVVKHRRRRRQ